MSARKKSVRAAFRNAVFTRDGHRCRVCGMIEPALDAHHITDRTLMPAGGYVPENGITLCARCHAKAEAQHAGGAAVPGYEPEALYRLIGSSALIARAASSRLLHGGTMTVTQAPPCDCEACR